MPATSDELTNVLLIEDNPTDVRLVEELLRSAPSDHFNIITASTLAKGLEHLAADQVDVILLDLGLPDSQGFDTFRTVDEHANNIPIIILTVSANEELGLMAIRAGAQRFFSKDVLTPDGAYAEMFPQIIHYAIEHKRVEAELQKEHEEVRRLNNALESKTEELRTANEELERRVEERTEELQTANENLLHEMGERLNAEQETQSRAHNTFILNKIIHALNEAPDLPTLYERALTTILEQLKLESGLIATVSDTGRLTVE
ncbi:MAG: response regulator, partial [Halobacteriota archaeon]